MDFVRLTLLAYGNSYRYIDATDLKMYIFSRFLTDDVGCYWPSFKKWALNNFETETSSNITSLRKENGYIYLSDLYSEEDVPTELKITVQQFVQLLDDWEAKVCKKKPKEVTIKYENDQFTIETKD
jgi:hypothetical protein